VRSAADLSPSFTASPSSDLCPPPPFFSLSWLSDRLSLSCLFPERFSAIYSFTRYLYIKHQSPPPVIYYRVPRRSIVSIGRRPSCLYFLGNSPLDNRSGSDFLGKEVTFPGSRARLMPRFSPDLSYNTTLVPAL